jgi:uncharacterized protein (TIGR04255 family)
MAIYSRPPISEQSIAVQFAEPFDLLPVKAFAIYEKLRDRLPLLELKERIGPLGVMPKPGWKIGDEITPRYWLSSRDEYLLLQVQSDMIAFNWRKRSPLDEPAAVPYPGFEDMQKRHQEFIDIVAEVCELKSAPEPIAINLYYDNVWRPADGENMADSFKFWKTLGVLTSNGPEIRLSVAKLQGASSETARIDVTVQGVGAPKADGTVGPVHRLILSAIDGPTESVDVKKSVQVLHERVTEVFEKIVSDKMLARWK